MQVAHLYIHPVKSLGAMAVARADIDRFGLQWDRRWMVVDDNGKFITQRQQARMALIKVRMAGEEVILTGPDGSELGFSAADFAAGPMLSVQVWRDECQAQVAEARINHWLSHQLQLSCRLVFMPESSRRTVDPDYAGPGHTVGFADGYPLLLTQQSSLEDFNRHMSINIGMERFRPNVVVTGAGPWQEDLWRVIQIGSTVFDVVKPCSRCAIPTIDPVDASKQPEVFRTLQKTRSRDGEVFFGQNLVPRSEGQLQVGDPVTVLA
ncbi:MOSC domain-containing protein [Ketobacter sp.]|uniref:MOSC domain-containing protein n=1 Tax=Ketobacter sp. TaxID=2083498 RepID=UPI0025B91DF3|nr:MOSC N-terminal beta barrel domain-containing protein [Ketobacter sp.]